MAIFAQFPRRNSVSAIEEEWDMIVRLDFKETLR